MAKHLRSMLLASVLPLSIITLMLSSNLHAKSEALCDQVFVKIKSDEPALGEEMDDLKTLCELDVQQSGPAYWQCVDGFMATRSYSSDNLILAGHLCATSEQVSKADIK